MADACSISLLDFPAQISPRQTPGCDVVSGHVCDASGEPA
jgi:hypothetical protein